MTIKIKRIYEPSEKSDGYRLLVDRLWPRGIKKETAQIDQWLKEISPSTELRKWFNHEPEKWQEFARRYHAELEKSAVLEVLIALIVKHATITLLYAAKDEDHNQAVALKQFITTRLAS